MKKANCIFTTNKNKLRNYLKKTMEYPLFFRLVWMACMDIPRGETRTYGWIAKKIGYPRSARAVGNALGKNPFAPFVPCHRVLRSDGSLGGYSGGTKKKKFLLKAEGIKYCGKY